MSGDDAVMEDVVDVGLGGEAAEGGCIVFANRGLDGGDTEVLVAVDEMGSGGSNAGFSVSGDSGVAIEDEIAVGSDTGSVDLSARETGEEEHQNGCACADGMA
jgi:hypothetical protein